jgi:hypothetical protein
MQGTWKGGAEDDSWLDSEYLNCQDLIEEYETGK